MVHSADYPTPKVEQPVRVVFYVPRTLDPQVRYRAFVECEDHREQRRWAFGGLETGEWAEAARMIWTRQADLILVARREHLPAEPLPRIEVVAEHLRPEHPPRANRPYITR